MKLFIILSLFLLACGGGQSTLLQEPVSKGLAEKKESKKQTDAGFSIVPYDINDIDIKEPIAAAAKEQAENVSVITTKGYRIQVAVLSDFTRTKEVVARLIGELKTSEHAVHVDFYSPNYRIRVGDFKTRDDAKKIIPMLQKIGYKDCFIVFDQVTLILNEKPQ